MNSKNFKIGYLSNHSVFLNIQNTGSNGHISLTGKSGFGKTYSQQLLLYYLKTRNVPVAVLDISGSFASEYLEPQLLNELGHGFSTWNVYTQGMPLDIFAPLQTSHGVIEHIAETANRLTDIFSKALKIGTMQKNTLYEGIMDILNEVMISNDSNPYYNTINWIKSKSPQKNLKLLQYYIYQRNRTNSESVLLKLNRLADLNIFRSQSNTYDLSTKITIFSIQNFSDDIKCIIADLFLWQLWNLKVQHNDGNKPLYIFIDEFQNMSFHAYSPLYKILCEGRKYGLNLLLGTQFVKGRYDKMQLAALEQVGTKIYFHPNDDEIASVARNIDPSNPKKWVAILQHLQKGYAVIKSTCCYFDDSTKPYTLPLKIKIDSFKY